MCLWAIESRWSPGLNLNCPGPAIPPETEAIARKMNSQVWRAIEGVSVWTVCVCVCVMRRFVSVPRTHFPQKPSAQTGKIIMMQFFRS